MIKLYFKATNEGKALNIIDVREVDEVATGKIPGAMNMPLGPVEFRMHELDKSKEYIMVCRSGGRRLPVVELTINSVASISDNGFKITHDPQIVLSADAIEDQVQAAQRAIEGADRGCEVGNLLKKADVTIEVKGKVSLK